MKSFGCLVRSTDRSLRHPARDEASRRRTANDLYGLSVTYRALRKIKRPSRVLTV